MHNAVSEGRRNYSSIIHTGRTTLNNSILKKGQFGSNLENLIRNKFSSCLVEYINTNNYEVVVGINNRNIIPPKEVDIPVIIIDVIRGLFFKFAIELNGEIYHSEIDRENIKCQELVNKGLVLFTIWQFGSTRTQTEYGDMETQIREICKAINLSLEKFSSTLA
jgi:hypothetical protein